VNLAFLESSPYLKGNTEAYLKRRGLSEEALFQEHILREYLGSLSAKDRVAFLALAAEKGGPARKKEAVAYLVDFWRDRGSAWAAFSEALVEVSAPAAWAEFARTVAGGSPEEASEWAHTLTPEARSALQTALGNAVPEPLQEALSSTGAALPPEVMNRVHRLRLEAAVNTPQESLGGKTPYAAFRDPALRPKVIQWVYALAHSPSEVRAVFDALQRTLPADRRLIEAYDLPCGLPGLFEAPGARMSDPSWESILKRFKKPERARQKWNETENAVFGGLSPLMVCAGPGPREKEFLEAFLKALEERKPADPKAFLKEFLEETEGSQTRLEAIRAERASLVELRRALGAPEPAGEANRPKKTGKAGHHRARRR
jgi:hypothetical protein